METDCFSDCRLENIWKRRHEKIIEEKREKMTYEREGCSDCSVPAAIVNAWNTKIKRIKRK